MIKATSELSMLLVSCVTTSGTTAVGLAGVMDTSKTSVLSESTLVPLGLFFLGLAMATTMVWKVATHKATVEARLKDLVNRIDRIEEVVMSIRDTSNKDS